jgi:hypothetical protein
MNELPRLVDGIQFAQMDDGVVVFREAEDRVHFLNSTAILILILCDGTNSPDEIAGLLQSEYGLESPPLGDVTEILGQLQEEGLLTSGKQLALVDNGS